MVAATGSGRSLVRWAKIAGFCERSPVFARLSQAPSRPESHPRSLKRFALEYKNTLRFTYAHAFVLGQGFPRAPAGGGQ